MAGRKLPPKVSKAPKSRLVALRQDQPVQPSLVRPDETSATQQVHGLGAEFGHPGGHEGDVGRAPAPDAGTLGVGAEGHGPVDRGHPGSLRVVFLVPRRNDNGHRDSLWAFCRAKWAREHPDWQIFEGHHTDGPFNRAAAINAAASEAGDWDVAIVIDADVMVDPEQVRAAVARASKTGHVVWAFTQWRGLTKAGTNRIFSGYQGDLGPLTEKLNPISWSCCFAVTRKVWDDVGGFDGRFRGWGYEDMAFRSAVETRHGTEHLPGAVTHLWHPRSDDRAEVRRPDGMVLLSPEYYDNTRLGTRWMSAEGCDHCVAALVDEAKAANREIRSGVTAVILTNGRKEYIARAIESAEVHLKGSHIVRRIWDDSGSVAFVSWLRDTYPAWRVVGDVSGVFTHRGYTVAMSTLWRYLGARGTTPYIFLLEEDFVLDADVDLDAMSQVIARNPLLAQVALLRQAFYPRELESDGVLAWPRESFTPVRMNGWGWLEHENFWTNNPTLFRRSLCSEVPWPMGKGTEAAYGAALRRRGYRFAFWGDGTPSVTHIGVERAANSGGY